MKKIILSIATGFIAFVTSAQAPQLLSYQTVIRNSTGTLVANQAVGMRISIRQGSNAGTAVYVETQSPTTNVNGLASISIGNGTVVTGTFAGINWGSGLYFIETQTDPTGGINYAITGTSQLLSVPYALYAQTAGNSNSGFTHYVGQIYGGGIIVSVWKDTTGVEHGLIASLSDISTSSVWSNVTSTLIGVTAENQSNGTGNTNAIIGQSGQTTSAALLCHNYNAGGYSDWYLPTIWELQQCYNAAMIVNNVLGNTNGFQTGIYWSSYEDNSTTGGTESFTFGYGTNLYTKGQLFSVRAVRRY